MSDARAPQAGLTRVALAYVAGVGAAIALFVAIAASGERLFTARAAGAIALSPPASMDALPHLLLALAVVIVTARVMGAAFRAVGQPPVMGEVVGGIMLGPSLLGAVWPQAYALVLPSSTAPFLGVISQLGIMLYMFIVGLHLDLRVVRTTGHATLAISHASIVVPFVLGAALALALYTDLAGERIAFTPFALFVGVSMSVTAFPVLARILSDKNLHRTTFGMLALTCAAIDDVTAWCLLALMVSVTQSTTSGAVVTLALTVVYVIVMLVFVRPIVARALPRLADSERLHQAGLATLFVAMLLSGLATEIIGIHAIFGAFLLGAIIPHASHAAADITDRLEDFVRVMFLPAFFAYTGMRTELGLLSTWQDWLICAGIVVIAIAGKFGGTYLAARFTGIGPRDAAALGILMNTRGLVELVVLNVGLDLGAISPRLFAMLVVMALVTTFMTGPILALLKPRDH
jgi:Kef-type K+ transport system membrane component KefB